MHRSPRRRTPRFRRKAGRRQAYRQKGDHISPSRPLIDEGGILGLIYSFGGKASLAEILGDHSLDRHRRRELVRLLDELCHRRVLRCEGKKRFFLAHPESLVEGVLTFHPRGYAFASLVGKAAGQGRQEDLFVPPRDTADARQGDRVLLQLLEGRGEKQVARVIKVLERGTNSIIGIYYAGRPTGMVEPDDERFPFRLAIRRENSLEAESGMAVVAEILSPDTGPQQMEGRIVRILGDPDSLKVQTEMVIQGLELPAAFSAAALDEARQLSREIRVSPGREDLTDVPHITIDGETARDFDDAVSVTKSKERYTLYVSIADVSHYVTPGSALDKDAYVRGTSVYFPNRVLPMLPEELSNGLCSLVPNQKRYAFTVILTFSPTGKLLKKSFCKSVIKSRHRMTYTLVKEIVVDRDKKTRRTYADIVPMLEEMAELGTILEGKRRRRGSIGFELPEGKVLVAEDGEHVADIGRRMRNQAHKIIEEFMLAANEAVAESHARFAGQAPPFLYRNHEAPDPIKAKTFADFAGSLGLTVPPKKEMDPAWFGDILRQVTGTPREYIISNLMLRVMQQARYAPENAGHFGLAATYYCHFTSPIRRYPDLLVHRSLQQMLRSDRKQTRKNILAGVDAAEAGEYLSGRERLSVDAERDILDRVKVLYMADKIGEDFTAVVSGVTSFGLFVELTDHYVSGAVALSDLKDDYYELDEKLHRLTGSRTGRVFQLGDAVNVRLVGIDRRRKHVNFTLAESNP